MFATDFDFDEPTRIDPVCRLPMLDMVETDRMERADDEAGAAEVAA